MGSLQGECLHYSILDPTGNITALVESAVKVGRQPSVAASLMERHPEVEQVGFVSYESVEGADAQLRMAGGEFCGNASISAAALYLLHGSEERADAFGPVPEDDGWERVMLHVSGAALPVEVRLVQRGDSAFDAGVHMPQALGVERVGFQYGGVRGKLPLVRMEGISHVIVGTDTPFFWLRDDHAAAEVAIRAWCADLGTDGLGLMFLEGDLPSPRMTPLVYVPGSNTVFWENSCASGSSAVGMHLAQRSDSRVDVTLQEPGGALRVVSDSTDGQTWLYGGVRLVGEFDASRFGDED